MDENWKFCAFCGANIEEIREKFTKELTCSIMASLENSEGKNNFTVKLIPRERLNAQLEGRKIYSKRQNQNSFLNTPNKKLLVVEPKTDITRLPGRITIDAELPEVLSGNDVKIMFLGESIEIRAIAPEKMYLKIMRIPKNMWLARSSFAEGRLRMDLGERIMR